MRAEGTRQTNVNETTLSELTDLLLDGEIDLKQLFEKPDSFNEAVILADGGWILAASPGACKIMGVSSQSDVIGKHCLDFVPSCNYRHVAKKIIMREDEPYTVTAQNNYREEFKYYVEPTIINTPGHHYALVRISVKENI